MKKLALEYPITITDTLTDSRQIIRPLHDEKILMYVCGITPYDAPHLGHGRVYVTFDVLFRLLHFLGYEVTYCRNFTDVDDKLINRAEKEHNDAHKYLEIATKYINLFHEDMSILNCLPPTFEPRVTQTIAEIVAFIQGLIDAGKAYAVGADVYYSIKAFPDYGKLSKRSVDDLIAGARVAVKEDKRDPLDFALWKSEDTTKPGWQSPWGWGRPGWHIECSAMANKFLGSHIDLHAGGMDLIFPHHENEIAQSEGLNGAPFARYWMHNAFVRIHQEKMSKSLGNFVTLRQACQTAHPMVVRYYYLSHHYRNPLDFSPDDIEHFAKSYQKLALIFAQQQTQVTQDVLRQSIRPNTVLDQLLKALCDDLNIAKLFGIIFENIKALQEDTVQLSCVRLLLSTVLGLPFDPLALPDVVITPQMERLIADRELARKNKEWAKADQLRDELLKLGYQVHDGKVKK